MNVHKFRLDERSIGLFRIIFGLVVIADFLLYKVSAFNVFLSPEKGILGNQFLDNYFGDSNFWSIMDFIRTDFALYLWIGITLIIYLLFLSGYKTKLTKYIAFTIYFMWHQRYFMITNGWEYYTDAIFLCALFLPLGNYFSIDNYFNKTKEKLHPWASFLMIVQIAVIYFFSAFNKHGIAWINGTAVQAMLMDLNYNRPLAYFMISHPILCKIITYFTLIIEFIIPFILLKKFNRISFKYLVIILIIMLHFSIDIFANIGLFKYLAIAIGVILLPSNFWERLGKRFYVNQNTNPSNSWVLKYLTWVLIYSMIITNLKYSAKKQTIYGEISRNTGFDKLLNTISIPRYFKSAYIHQGWSYYAPKPISYSIAFHIIGTSQVGKKYYIIKPRILKNKKTFLDYNESTKFILLKWMILNQRNFFYKNLIYQWGIHTIKIWQQENPKIKLVKADFIMQRSNNYKKSLPFEFKNTTLYVYGQNEL